MADSTVPRWYYLPSGAEASQQVGPLTWEQLYTLRSSGSLQPDDLVWHPMMSEWEPAAQVPGLFSAGAAPAAYQPAAHPRSRTLYWLLPLIALVVIGAGLGTYFGLSHDSDDGVSADPDITSNLLLGSWEGTLKYESIDIDEATMTEDDKALREKLLSTDIPISVELWAGSPNVAFMVVDMTVIDPSYDESMDNLTWTYDSGKITFTSDDGATTVTAAVGHKDGGLEMKGEMAFKDETGSGKAVWTMSQETEKPDNIVTTTTDGSTSSTSDQTTSTTEAETEGVTGDFNLNGTWVGTWTFTSIEAASDQEEWDEEVNDPKPLTMEVELGADGTGTADCVIDMGETGEYVTHVDFIYADGELECVGWDYDVEGIPATGKVTQRDGQLVWEGTFLYNDLGNLKYEAVWTATKQ